MLVPLLEWYGHGPTNYLTFVWWLSCLWCWGWHCQRLELADASVSISSPFPTALNPIFRGHEPCKCKSMNTFCQQSTLTGSLCPSFGSDFVWELLNSLSFLVDWAFHWASPIVCSDLNASYRWWPTCHTRPSVKTKVEIYMNLVDRGVMCFSVCYDVWKQKNLCGTGWKQVLEPLKLRRTRIVCECWLSKSPLLFGWMSCMKSLVN